MTGGWRESFGGHINGSFKFPHEPTGNTSMAEIGEREE